MKQKTLKEFVYNLDEYNPNSFRDISKDKKGVVGNKPPQPQPSQGNPLFRDISKDKPGFVGVKPLPLVSQPRYQTDPNARKAIVGPPPLPNAFDKTDPDPRQSNPNGNTPIPKTREQDKNGIPVANSFKPTPANHGAQRDRWNNPRDSEPEQTPADKMKSVIDFSAEKISALTNHLVGLPVTKQLPVYKQMVEGLVNFYTQIANYAVRPEHKQILLKAADALTAAYKQLPG